MVTCKAIAKYIAITINKQQKSFNTLMI